MRIHHLNTGTMCPIGRRFVNGTGGIFQRARMVCHCLLVETNDGLALVDTGIGLDDIAQPLRLGRKWVRQTAPRLDPSEMAVLHKTAAPKGRYVTDQWKHGPEWTFYGEGGDDWFGFKGVRALGDREPDILMIPLPGHTPGHCGIAVRAKDKWLLHAGDSYFFHGQLQAKVRMPLVLGYFQRKADLDRNLRMANQERLRQLKSTHGHEVTIFNSHDPVDYENCRCGQH
jgi:glyoxylase-like metal-dependent hydrolase (beta-lactamase superfamily II)